MRHSLLSNEHNERESQREIRMSDKSDKSFLPYLFFLLGMSTWFAFSTISSQAPVFTSCSDDAEDNNTDCEKYVLPEGLEFSSYINVASQLGNLLPLMYKISDKSESLRRAYLTTFISLTLGTISLIVAAFAWDITTYLGGDLGHKSVILLFCTFVCGATGCLHSVLFWRIASSFSVRCVRMQSIGSACGGVFPMIVALLQLDDPRLTFILAAVAQTFFIFAFFRIFREFSSSHHHHHHHHHTSSILNKCENNNAQDEEQNNNAQDEEEHKINTEISIMYSIGFILYLCAYSIPSFIPLMTSAYTFSKRLYTLINVSYTCGDVVGRVLTSLECLSRPPRIRTLIYLTLFAFAVYGVLMFSACATDSIERVILPGEVSNILIAVFFMFYCARGFVVTSMYVSIRVMSPSSETSSFRSGRLGYLAQLGAAIGAVGSFLILNFCS